MVIFAAAMAKIYKRRGWKVGLTLPKGNSTFSAAGITAAMKGVLHRVRVERGIYEVSVLITNDRAIRKLNARFRNKDKPTDVLSFPMGEAGILGDIVISHETARRQAAEYDVNLYQELLRLLIHGVLHLCGYDHEDVPLKEAQRMRRLEERLYRQLLPSAKKMVRTARAVRA